MTFIKPHIPLYVSVSLVSSHAFGLLILSCQSLLTSPTQTNLTHTPYSSDMYAKVLSPSPSTVRTGIPFANVDSIGNENLDGVEEEEAHLRITSYWLEASTRKKITCETTREWWRKSSNIELVSQKLMQEQSLWWNCERWTLFGAYCIVFKWKPLPFKRG